MYEHNFLIIKLLGVCIILKSCAIVDCLIEMDIASKKASYMESQVGSYVVFNCALEFPHETEIPYILHWNKDDREAFSWHDGTLTASQPYVGRVNLLENSYGYGHASVNLTAIRETDSGWYECRVIFPNRTPSIRNNGTWFHLAVDGGSLVKIPPINQTVMEGDNAIFHCTTKYPGATFVTWYKDGMPLLEMEDLSRRSLISPEGDLMIQPTVMTDLGEFKCVVKSIENEEQTVRAFLNIQYKAKVVYAPKEVYLPYGQPAVLDCHFRSNPPLTNLRWEKDGFLFDPYNVQGVFYRRNGSLFFNSVDESHGGRYSCTPYNELGTEGPSTLIEVIVQRPPVFTTRPQPIYVNKLGETVEMECDAMDREGNHRAVIQWRRKDGTQLPFGRVSFDGIKFIIENINETDRGMYECTATNNAATILADTELKIENFPSRPPYNLTANSSDTAITIRWEPGYYLKYIEYVVWYRQTDAPEWRTMRILSPTAMEATITHLEPNHEYEFMVLSQDRYGEGMFSRAYKYFTKPLGKKDVYNEHTEHAQEHVQQFIQIGPPRNLTVMPTSTGDEFVVSWLPPEHGLDSLRVYIVRWYREPGHYLHGSSETRENYYKVRYLAEDETYNFQVFALSVTDYSAGSIEFEIIVPPYRRVRAIAIGATIGLIVLLTAASIFIYAKKRCFQPYKDSDEKIPRP